MMGDMVRLQMKKKMVKSSALFLDGEPLPWDQLPTKVAEAKAKAGNQPLNALIAADKETPHGSVVKLIDTVRKHGITDFAINVEAGASEP